MLDKVLNWSLAILIVMGLCGIAGLIAMIAAIV